jgi:hypothetical protein
MKGIGVTRQWRKGGALVGSLGRAEQSYDEFKWKAGRIVVIVKSIVSSAFLQAPSRAVSGLSCIYLAAVLLDSVGFEPTRSSSFERLWMQGPYIVATSVVLAGRFLRKVEQRY